MDDYLERRVALRDAHLEKAWAATANGSLVLAGAFANPVDGAVLLFRGGTSAVGELFAVADPYVVNGVIKRGCVREWTTVAGKHASTPVRPIRSERDESRRT